MAISKTQADTLHCIDIIKTFDIEPQDFYVYVHIRSSDGRAFYVGKGKNKRYSNTFDRNPFWKRTARKYGVKVIIFRDRLQEWAAFELEQELIALYGRRDTGSGYLCNLSDGGEGQCGAIPTPESNIARSLKLKGRVMTKEHRTKIGDKSRGRVVSQETRLKLSEGRKGRFVGKNHPLFGVKKSAESIEKTAAPQRKMVICVETGEIFNSISEAALKVNSSTSPISKVCNGKQKTCKGFTWKYFEPLENAA